jgi:hypothetical protein
MPDSQQPPSWGPAYHERDLDVLLSGEAGNTPVALRRVDTTLAALRAAPTARELSGEAAARAAFREIAQPQVPWTVPVEHGIVAQDTLVLPPGEYLLPPVDRRLDHRRPRSARQSAERLPARADRRRPRTARHRRRRATWDGRRSAIAWTSVGVVAVIVIAVAVTGAIPGSIGQMMSIDGHPTSAASSPAPSRPAPGSLDGNGHVSHPTPSAPVTGTPSVTPSATTSPGALCREFLASLWQKNGTARRDLLGELIQQAGGLDKVRGYCSTFWTKEPRTYPTPPPGGYPAGPGDRGRGYPGAGNSGVQNMDPGYPGFGYSGGSNSGDPLPSLGASPSAASADADGVQGQRGVAALSGRSNNLRLPESGGQDCSVSASMMTEQTSSKAVRWASLSRSKISRRTAAACCGAASRIASAPPLVSATKAPRPSTGHSRRVTRPRRSIRVS